MSKRAQLKRAPMTAKTTIANKCTTVKISMEMRLHLQNAVKECIKACNFPYLSEVHITFVGLKGIKSLNRRFREKDVTTDVLSFPTLSYSAGVLEIMPGDLDQRDNRCFLGDVVVCLPKMQEQAKEYGHSELRELTFLIVHGALHLLGFDHELLAEEANMVGMQKRVMSALGFADEWGNE